jgi:hypothetical protein
LSFSTSHSVIGLFFDFYKTKYSVDSFGLVQFLKTWHAYMAS